MAFGNFAHGIGAGDTARCDSGYLYLCGDAADPFDNDCLVDTIKVAVEDIGGNDQLRIWHGYMSGNDLVFYDYDPIVTLTLSSTTGWITFTAPDDFTAFEVEAGDVLVFYSHDDDCRPGRSSTGDYLTYKYTSADPPYSTNLTITTSGNAYRLEFKAEGTEIGGAGTNIRPRIMYYNRKRRTT